MSENLWVDQLCVQVVETHLSGFYGAYLHQHRLILLDARLGPIQRRSTLMHELGHAFYGHTDSSARSEREASEWAARQLIPYCQYHFLTCIYDSPVSVASELGVLPRDVVNFREWVERRSLAEI